MLTENKSVVSNSSPLMNLAIIGQINLLRELFLKITVPEEVWQELTVDGKDKPGADEILHAAQWIEVVRVKNTALVKLLNKDLDSGESAAIALAIERKANLILLDESDARLIAEFYQLPKTGVLGILMRAKKYRMIKEVRPLLDSLMEQANFRIAENLYEDILFKTDEL